MVRQSINVKRLHVRKRYSFLNAKFTEKRTENNLKTQKKYIWYT